MKPALLVEATVRIKEIKRYLFSTIARVIVEPLSDAVKAALKDDSLLSQLSESEMDLVLSRVTALLTCGVCSQKHSCPQIYEHVRDRHGTWNIQIPTTPEVDCLVPSLSLRTAVLNLVKTTPGLDEQTTTTADSRSARCELHLQRSVQQGVEQQLHHQRRRLELSRAFPLSFPRLLRFSLTLSSSQTKNVSSKRDRFGGWYYSRRKAPVRHQLEDDEVRSITYSPPPPPAPAPAPAVVAGPAPSAQQR